MIDSRIYKPNTDSILYHYCSVETLQAICTTKSIRMSDINMMNDYYEVQYGYELFEEAATEIIKDEKISTAHPDFNLDFFNNVDEAFRLMQYFIHPIIASLSKEPDVLSQWYRYANAGDGFSVGFSAVELSQMPLTLLEIEYDRETQIKEVREALTRIFLRNKIEALNYNEVFRRDCILFGISLMAYKHKSFAEEKEVRLLHCLDVASEVPNPKLLSVKKTLFGFREVGVPVSFRVVDGAYVAYLDCPFPQNKKTPVIREVWLGPKNKNALGNVTYMMNSCDLTDYKLLTSEATLR